MPEQITRLLIFFLLILLAYFVIRPALIPDSYSLYGRYRAAAIEEIRAKEPVHIGREGCEGCHEEQVSLIGESRHAGISCESCHTAGAAHSEAPETVGLFVPTEERMRQYCGLCHHQRVGRPLGFPQVDIEEHNVGDLCTDCHGSPHEVEDW